MYFFIVFSCMLCIIVVNSLFIDYLAPLSVLDIICACTLAVIAQIILDLILALIVRRCLPKKLFLPVKKFFSATKKETAFYEKIKIKSWKEKVLELGALTGFRKNKIASPKDQEYISRYIFEANCGVLVHIVCIIFGFLITFMYPLKYFVNFCLPVSIVNAALNLLPLMTLRYNLVKLNKIFLINKRRES